ncbi:MAG: hypothetical protein Q9222_005536 [Ikaeria aurantiellina]
MSSESLPPGVEPNYINPPSEGYKIIDATAISLTFAIVFVVLRLMTKFLVTHAPGWDDWFAVLALLLSIGRAACSFVLVNRDGIGRDFLNIPKQSFGEITILLPASDILYVAGITFAKLSILVLYYRIFGVDRNFRYACIALVVLVAGYGTACDLAKIFLCRPVKAGWDPSYEGPKHCSDHIKIDFVIGWFSIFTDFAIFLMPAPMLWNLHLARYKKIVFLYAGHDTPDSLVWNNIVFTLELNVGIMCGCLPILQPMLKHVPVSKYIPSSVRSYFSSKSKGSYRSPKIYIKRSNTTDQSSKGDDIELREHKHPIVSDAGYPAKDSNDDLRSQHNHGGIMRTDRFEVHSDDNV